MASETRNESSHVPEYFSWPGGFECGTDDAEMAAGKKSSQNFASDSLSICVASFCAHVDFQEVNFMDKQTSMTLK